jgi:hypothetical protein
MDAKNVKIITDAMARTTKIHEASYDRQNWCYQLSWDQAAEKAKVPESIRGLVVASLAAGYCEFDDWEKQAGKTASRQIAKENAMMRAKPKGRGR